FRSLDVSLTEGGQLQNSVVANDQVKSNAAIEESKILFSPTGHNHDGSNSKKVNHNSLVISENNADHDARYIVYTGNYYFKRKKIISGLARRSSSDPKKTDPFILINEDDIRGKTTKIRGTIKFAFGFIIILGPYEVCSFGENTGAEVWVVMRRRSWYPYNYYFTTSFKCRYTFTSGTNTLTLDLDSNNNGHLFGIVKSDNEDIPTGIGAGVSYTLEISWS
ncbi:MAG: hypothetical protein ACFFC7_27080, partial [Candidatus Hermodarchaeota archaeon]